MAVTFDHVMAAGEIGVMGLHQVLKLLRCIWRSFQCGGVMGHEKRPELCLGDQPGAELGKAEGE